MTLHTNPVEYDGLAERIQNVYSSCSLLEQRQLITILEEMSRTGESATLESIYLTDFKEVPMSIDEFVCSPYYLGNTNRNGEAVYPFWRQMLRDLFGAGNRYNEIVLSGATRIGKTSTAVIIMAYMLYRLMLYRNPHEYFKKKEVSKFYLGFANLTKELAAGVAYREFNDTLKDSPWFNDHGRFSRSDRNFYYIPEGDKIDIIAGSDAAHMLGLQLWSCLVGDTKILTSDGYHRIDSLAGTRQSVIQMSDDRRLMEVEAEIKLTKHVSDTIRITLEDGTVIEGTPDHRLMKTDGTYVMLKDLTEDDDILTFNLIEVDEMNLECYDKKFTVYMHVSPNDKRYVGITSQEVEVRWQRGNGYRDNLHFKNAIKKYGWDNFEHLILATDLTLSEACKMEQDLIAQYCTMNPEHGYNHTTGGNWSTPDDATRKKLSESLKRVTSNPEYRKKISERLKGHVVSQATRDKISVANSGRHRSKPVWNKGITLTEEQRTKLRGHSPWCKGLTKETDSRLAAMSESRKGRQMSEESIKKLSQTQKRRYAEGFNPVWVNNGQIETYIQQGEEIPEGYVLGRLNMLDTYIHRGEENKKINANQLDEYLSQGWSAGRSNSVGEAIRRANQKYYWTFEDIRFDSSVELATYLNSHGYPKIVGSTITALYKKGFGTSKTYKSLEGKIEKVDVDEDK